MNKRISLKENSLDGKKIGYSSETEFLVQVGKGPKGKYTTRYFIKGNLYRATLFYNGINLGPGYKKRLLMPNGMSKGKSNPVLMKSKNY